MSRKSKALQFHVDDQVDLTPMLDVVFILLIFFVVTASFLKETAIPLQQPSPDKDTTNDNESMMFLIEADDQIYLDGRRVDSRAVRSLIEQYAAQGAKPNVVVRAHDQSSTGAYIEVADAARLAGVSQVALTPYPNIN